MQRAWPQRPHGARMNALEFLLPCAAAGQTLSTKGETAGNTYSLARTRPRSVLGFAKRHRVSLPGEPNGHLSVLSSLFGQAYSFVIVATAESSAGPEPSCLSGPEHAGRRDTSLIRRLILPGPFERSK